MIISNFQVVEVNCSIRGFSSWQVRITFGSRVFFCNRFIRCLVLASRTSLQQHVRCPPCSAKCTRPTKKGGNYTEETDRHVPIELGSVNVHWLKVEQCLRAGWAWRQTTAYQADCSTSGVVAHGNHTVMFKVKNVVYVTITQDDGP